MKIFNQKTNKIAILIAVVFAISFTSKSATYTTINDGNWNNSIDVWSLDGVTPCGCQPSATINGDTIDVRHDILLTSTIFTTNNSVFTVESSGSIDGSFNIVVSGCEVNFFGPVSIAKMIINSTGVLNVTAALMTLSNRLIVDGTLNIDAGYVLMTGGNIAVSTFGTINMVNAGKIDSSIGNVEIEGTVNICSNCCITTKGNWKNVGDVKGTGACISTAGNMTNTGFWSSSVVWCSLGFDIGMPTPQDCINANSICGIVSLPVQLTAFNAELLNDSRVIVTWETATEKNSDYFVVLKSLNGSDWDEVEVVTAAGNSIESNCYFVYDFNIDFEIVYYRLVQVDFDGTKAYSDVRAVISRELGGVTIFPNPAKLGDARIIAITNVENADIAIIDLRGESVFTTFSENNTKIIDLTAINAGVYIVKVHTKEGGVESQRLVVMD